MRQEFYVETIPKGQPRPRFYRRGNFVGAYDPKDSKGYKEDIRLQVISEEHTMMDGPLSLMCSFYMPRPKAHHGKGGVKPSAPVWHDKKPDLDNLIKAVKDSLTGVLWRDDSQICTEVAAKRYAEQPGIRIIVENAIDTEV